MFEVEDDSGCPNPEALARFLSQGDDGVATHLQGCAACRRLVADVADGGDDVGHLRRGSVLGRYTITDTLGVGGMGIVYLAHDAELDRTVAIKVSLRTELGAKNLERLHVEAKAMARLSHPNVATVYDVGWSGEDLFLVMEHVAGQSLAAWLKQPHDAEAIRDAFAQAGRGLLAIHRVDLAHGDFKPSNVVVGDDGAVRVIDFGLAGRSSSETRAVVVSSSTGKVAASAPGSSGQAASSTMEDTLAYASALLYALCGVRPSKEGWGAVLRRSKVPRKLRQRLRAALLQPSDAASLPELVQAVSVRRPSTLVRAGLWTAVPVVIGVATAAAGWLGSPPTPSTACQDAGAEAVAVFWGSPTRQAVRGAFVDRGGAYGKRMWASVERGLDSYAHQWSQRSVDGCLRSQPAPVAASVQACLGAHRASFETTTALLIDADAATLANALRIVEALPDLEACDEDASGSLNPNYVIALQEVLALRYARRYEAGLPAARRLVQFAEDNGDARMQAEAAAELGHVLMQTLQPEEALTALRKAVRLATEAGDIRLVVRTYADQASVLAVGLGRFDDGLAALDTAVSLTDANDPHPQAVIFRARANLLLYAGRYDACAESAEQALANARRAGPDAPRTWVQNLVLLATCESVRGRHTQARKLADEAVEITKDVFGVNHPQYASALQTSGIVGRAAGKTEATALLEQAAALYRKLEAGGSVKTVELNQTLNHLASAYVGEHRFAEAIAVRRQVIERLDDLDTFPAKRARARLLLAEDLMAATRFDDAEVALAEAETLATSMPQPHPHIRSGIYLYRGIIADHRGQGKKASEALRTAHALVWPMREEADTRDNVLPYIDSTIAWYAEERISPTTLKTLLASTEAAKRSTDPCVVAVVLSRAVRSLPDGDARVDVLTARVDDAIDEGLARGCYLEPVARAMGLAFAD